MKKDQMAAELEKLKAELEAAKKQIEATAGANAILEEELKELREQKNENPGDNPKIGILLEAIRKSCEDHCPHHLDLNACPNCTIYKKVSETGWKIKHEAI